MFKRVTRILLLVLVCYCVIMVYNLPTLDFNMEHGPVHVFKSDEWNTAKNVQLGDINKQAYIDKPAEIDKPGHVAKTGDVVNAVEEDKPFDINISTDPAEPPNLSPKVNQKVAKVTSNKPPVTDISDTIAKSALEAKKAVKPTKTDTPIRKRHQDKEAKPLLDVSSAKDANPGDVVKSVKPAAGNERPLRTVKQPMEECSPDFGNDSQVFCNESVPKWKELIGRFPKLQKGGHYIPKNCVPQPHVAIIVPYRDRDEHLKLFLQHMHNFLQSKEIEYTIFIVEQDNSTLFKKGLLMNAGFLEVTRRTDISCYMFHDVDMLPLDYRVNYSCTERTVWHPSIYIRQYHFRKPYGRYFGGVLTFQKQTFKKVNGFSNLYWGWGGEDDDMYFRLKAKNIRVEEPNDEVRYESWSHTRQEEFANRREFIMRAAERMHLDGLNSAKYQLLQEKQLPLYTRIYVSANQKIASYDNLTAFYIENSRTF